MICLSHPRKLTFFAALSAADLALTMLLLAGREDLAYESNPAAAWCLTRFGWEGLAGYKAGSVLLVAGLALAVSRTRPRAAGRVLVFACSALLAVVLYSGLLMAGVGADGTLPEADRLVRARERDRDLEGLRGRRHAFAELQARLSDDLAAGRRALAEAAEELARTAYVREGDWLRLQGWNFPGHTTEERLAAHLASYALHTLEVGPEARARFALDLRAQFRSRFGREFSGPVLDEIVPAGRRADDWNATPLDARAEDRPGGGIP